MIDLLHRVVDSASAIIGESRVYREEPVVRGCEADRLPVTLAATGEEEPIRQGGAEADSHRVDDIGAVAVEFASQRSAEQQRDAARARLEALAGELHEAQARLASLNPDLRAAEEIKAKLEAEVDTWRSKDAEYQRFRGQSHWLGVFAERRMRGSGKWEDDLKVGFAFLSLFGQHKYGLVQRFCLGRISTRPVSEGSRI
jgi:hypothetical protein